MKLPDYITCLNLLCGLLAIYAALQGRPGIAALLLPAGAFFDAIDGYVARRMGIESAFGADMDSLSDLVTFGVAPMVLLMTYYDTAWLSLLSVLIPLAGALRLARHNINRHLTKGFLIGVPITVSGAIVPLLIAFELSSTVAGVVTGLLAVSFVSSRRVNKLLK